MHGKTGCTWAGRKYTAAELLAGARAISRAAKRSQYCTWRFLRAPTAAHRPADQAAPASAGRSTEARPGFRTGCTERQPYSTRCDDEKLVERSRRAPTVSGRIGCPCSRFLASRSTSAKKTGIRARRRRALRMDQTRDETGATRERFRVMGERGSGHQRVGDETVFVATRGSTAATTDDSRRQPRSTSATGGARPSCRPNAHNRATSTHRPRDQYPRVRGVGVKWVRTVRRQLRQSAGSAAKRERGGTTRETGPKVLIEQRENACSTSKPTIGKEARGAQGHRGRRSASLRERVGVDGRHAPGRPILTFRPSGCPSLFVSRNPDRWYRTRSRQCSTRGRLRRGAVEGGRTRRACPSLSEAQIVSNPDPWDRRRQRVSNSRSIGCVASGDARDREPVLRYERCLRRD